MLDNCKLIAYLWVSEEIHSIYKRSLKKGKPENFPVCNKIVKEENSTANSLLLTPGKIISYNSTGEFTPMIGTNMAPK
jgi:hypothetical protein